MDNAPDCKILPKCKVALEQIKVEHHYFPQYSTHLVQPCDCFVISKMHGLDSWQSNGGEGTSGIMQHPRKRYFLELVVACVRDVNAQKGKRYTLYAQNVMIVGVDFLSI